MQEILVPISPGELLDKITILRIKSDRMHDPVKLANVTRELVLLEAIWRTVFPVLSVEESALMAVNTRLWDIEDLLRACEEAQRFDAEFVELARAVYFHNDDRAAIKKRINVKLGSVLVEEKSYGQ